jgi:[protein-PII] uridylyltransferase
LATDAWLENQSGIARPISGAGREGLEKLAQAFTTEPAKRFIRTLPGRYIDATPVETIEEDYRRYGEYNESRRPVAEFSPSVVPGHAVFHIVARDRPGFLFKVSGVLASFGVSVHSAQINTTTEGVVLNRFDVEKVPDTAIERLSLAERIARRLEDVLEGKADLDKLLAERRKARKFAPPTPDVRTDVVTNINDSQRFTIVEITTRDRVALLHDVARAFNGWGADISLAMIDTQGNRAVDTFYVTDRSGKKIADPTRLASLSEFLVKTVAAEG